MFNSRVAASVAAISGLACLGGVAVCSTVGLYSSTFKCLHGAVACTGYVTGAHRADPGDPVVSASAPAVSMIKGTLSAEPLYKNSIIDGWLDTIFCLTQ
jgi:hypothetical protein